jgi:predicted transcriptional regulator
MADEQLRLQATVVDNFSRPLANLQNRLRVVTKAPGLRDMQRDWQGIGSEITRVSRTISTTFAPALANLGGLSLGAGGALTAVAMSVRNFSAGVQGLKRFSEETGIAADRVRAFNELGERFGVSTDTMKGAMQTLATNMFDLRRRWGQAYGELRAMNLGDLADDLAKSANNQEAMTKAFQRLGRIPDPEVRRRVSALLFGTPEIGSVAAAVGGDLEKLLGEIEARQGRTTERMTAAAGKFEENMSRMRQSMENLKINTLGPLLETWNDLVVLMQKPIDIPVAKDPKGRERADQIRRQIDVLEGLGNAGPGGAPRSPETQRKIDKLNEELRRLTTELEKLNQGGATAQKSSFGGIGAGGGFGGLIHNASLGSVVGLGRGAPGGGYGGGAAGPGVSPSLKGAEPGAIALGRLTGTGIGHAASRAEMAAHIRAAAAARGIDPNIALRVAQSEGLNKYAGDPDAFGKPTSFGPFQLH